MQSGRLDKSLRIEKRTRVSDGGGGHEEGWETFIEKVSARIIPKSGTEKAHADTLAGINTYEIHLRAFEQTRQITNLMRAVDRRTGVIHNVRGVLESEDRVIVILHTQTGVRT